MNEKLTRLINGKTFHDVILFLIILNAIVIGLDTYPSISAKFGDIISAINHLCLIVFTIEILLRLFVERINFIKSGWNIFDFIIIFVSLTSELTALSIFRTFRLIRILRVISSIPKMQLISTTLIRSCYSMLGVAILLSLIFYIYAVTTTEFYGKDFPEFFGSLDESIYTLFQIMTFESWSMAIVRPIMEIYPNAWIVFISFILIATYIVLNIVIGIIVDCIDDIKETAKNTQRENSELVLHNKIDHLEKELQEIKMLLLNSNKEK